jgi:GTPase SAR1 family protein
MAKIRWGKMRPEPETAVRKWKKKVEDECGDIPMVLVQNKIDLVSQSEIDQ